MTDQETAAAQQRQQAEAEARRTALLARILSPEARERVARIGTVRPAEARAIESMLITAAQNGSIRSVVSEAELKTILEGVQGGQGVEDRSRIVYHRKQDGLWSDDE